MTQRQNTADNKVFHHPRTKSEPGGRVQWDNSAIVRFLEAASSIKTEKHNDQFVIVGANLRTLSFCKDIPGKLVTRKNVIDSMCSHSVPLYQFAKFAPPNPSL